MGWLHAPSFPLPRSPTGRQRAGAVNGTRYATVVVEKLRTDAAAGKVDGVQLAARGRVPESQ